ncbi:MAG: hypothetical protein JXX28_07580 [Deltaproteobacteria bacterium]|nr:hypothetical protein [Deltaproteobacteria bacterium]
MLALLLALTLPARAGELHAGGEIGTHLRVGLRDCGGDPSGCPVLDYGDLATVTGRIRAEVGPRAEARASLTARLHSGVPAAQLEDTAETSMVLHQSLRLREAVVDLREVGRPDLDVILGVQTLRWGTADGLHVVDRLNPWDLEDPLRLDARLPVPALQALLHRGGLSLQAVWIPVSWPAVLPRQGVGLVPEAGDLLDPAGMGAEFEDLSLRIAEARVTPPPRTLAGMGGGLRLAWAGPSVDAALVASAGRDSLPQLDGELLLTGFQTSASRVDVTLPLRYPMVQALGAEARGELGWEIGVWGELAVVFPEATEGTASPAQLEALARLGTIDQVPDPLPTLITQDGAPYPNWIAGAERSFGRVYLNLQWLHGFPTERQREDLRDYASLATRISLGDTAQLTVRLLGDLGAQGGIASADLDLLHGDAAEVQLGAAWVEAREGAGLAPFEGMSQVHGGVKLVF